MLFSNLVPISGTNVPPNPEQVAYLDLIGARPTSLNWLFICSSFDGPFCASQLQALFGDSSSLLLSVFPGNLNLPTFPFDAASGTVTATDLATTPTQEPATVSLLLLGIGVLGLLYTASKGLTAAA
jgi:hypothetical protein